MISTRDDIMNYLIFKGLPPQIAFKIMEKSEKVKDLHPEDIQMMKRIKFPDGISSRAKKLRYMFPKAHAVAYVMIGYAYCLF